MEKARENISRSQELAIPRVKIDRNLRDPFKVKNRELSYSMTNQSNPLTRPKKITFADESINRMISQVSKILPIKIDERKFCVAYPNRTRLPNNSINCEKNQLDLETYAQMVKRGSMSSGISNSLNNPRRSTIKDKTFGDHSSSQGSKIRGISEGVNYQKTYRTINRLNLDAYAEKVVNNDKQCPDRIKRLAIPRKSITFADKWSIGNNWMFGNNFI